VYDSLVKGLDLIKIENWLQVIPQLIARIDTNRQRVGKLIHKLLCDISKHHPQVRTLFTYTLLRAYAYTSHYP